MRYGPHSPDQPLALNEEKLRWFYASHTPIYHVMNKGLQRIGMITTVQEAVAASKVPGTHLLVATTFSEMQGVVRKLQSANDNDATGLEYEMTHSIVCDETYLSRFGKLHLINGGRSFTVKNKNESEAETEFDGAVGNSTVLLLLEVKRAANVADVAQVKNAWDFMSKVLQAPGDYESEPPHVMEELSGLKLIVPILGAYNFPLQVIRECEKENIECRTSNGKSVARVTSDFAKRSVRVESNSEAPA